MAKFIGLIYQDLVVPEIPRVVQLKAQTKESAWPELDLTHKHYRKELYKRVERKNG